MTDDIYQEDGRYRNPPWAESDHTVEFEPGTGDVLVFGESVEPGETTHQYLRVPAEMTEDVTEWQ